MGLIAGVATEASSSQLGLSLDLVALDDAFSGLARLDAQQARIVEWKFFGGLSIEDAAHLIGVSRTTIKPNAILGQGPMEYSRKKQFSLEGRAVGSPD
jgi:DNA-directed RNA polymerase specialized sigma24 family protein